MPFLAVIFIGRYKTGKGREKQKRLPSLEAE
jgi:hypothetical protein